MDKRNNSANHANNSTGTEIMNSKDNLNLLPHLESLERMLGIPVVGAAWQQSQDVYEKVKCHNRMFSWAFNTAEDAVHRAVYTAAPIVSKFDRPIQYVDQTLVKGIDKLEVKAPIIKEQPQEIYNQAKNKVIDAVQPHISKVCALRVAGQQKAASLKDLSWQKANEVLATQYGSMAVQGVDTTSALAERLLDYYFPRYEADVEDDSRLQHDELEPVIRRLQPVFYQNNNNSTPISSDADPVLHTVQTVGRLSNKVARRVYRTVSRQIKQLKKEDVHEYVASLIAVLRLTQYLNFINEKVQQSSSSINEKENSANHQQENHHSSQNNQIENHHQPEQKSQPEQNNHYQQPRQNHHQRQQNHQNNKQNQHQNSKTLTNDEK